jgi:hypothetical protein
MAAYHGVHTMFWAETRAWADDERVCALFLLTCEHRRTEGLYRLPSVYAAHDMGWTVARFEGALALLQQRGWVIREDDWVMLSNGLRWNAPKGEPQEKGAARVVENVPRDSRVYRAFYDQAGRYAEGLRGRLDPPVDRPEGVSRPSSRGAGDPSGSSTPPPAPTPSLPPAPAAAADDALVGAGEAEVAAWRALDPVLRQVPEWAAALDQGAGVACLALLQANRDVPWPQIAAAATASRLDPEAGLRTNSPRQALDMQLADHRAGRSTGTVERGAPRRASRSSLDHYRDMAAAFALEESAEVER